MSKFIYKGSLFLITGLLLVYMSFRYTSVPESVAAFSTGCLVIYVVAKDTINDKSSL